MLVQSAAMEVEQPPGPAGGVGPAGSKAPDRLAARPNSTLIQASVGAAELQAALPLRPATRVVLPFLLHAPQVRPRAVKLRPGASPCVHAPACQHDETAHAGGAVQWRGGSAPAGQPIVLRAAQHRQQAPGPVPDAALAPACPALPAGKRHA